MCEFLSSAVYPLSISEKICLLCLIANKCCLRCRSNKLKPFWHGVNERIPVMEYLSSALLSSEYERALARALAMPECPVVPFFGAFLRELREVIACEMKVNTKEHYHCYCSYDIALYTF